MAKQNSSKAMKMSRNAVNKSKLMENAADAQLSDEELDGVAGGASKILGPADGKVLGRAEGKVLGRANSKVADRADGKILDRAEGEI